MTMHLCGSIFTSVMVLFMAIPQRQAFHLVILTLSERVDLRKIAESAIADMSLELSDLKVSFEHLKINGTSDLVPTMQTYHSEILRNETQKPNLLVDLLPGSITACWIQQVACSMDIPLITMDIANCPEFTTQLGTRTDKFRVPALRHAEKASIGALIVYMDKKHRFHTGNLLFLDQEYEDDVLLSNRNNNDFLPRYMVRLTNPIDLSFLVQIVVRFMRITQTESWTYHVTRDTMAQILQFVAANGIRLSETVSLMVYDDSLSVDECLNMCYHINGTADQMCGLSDQKLSFHCVKLDLSEANWTTVETVKRHVGSPWNTVFIDQAQISYAYETIKTGLYGLRVVQESGGFTAPVPSTELANGSLMGSPSLIYQYSSVIQQLPERNGAVGPIRFNGTWSNRYASFRIFQCNTTGMTGPILCEGRNSSYSYPDNRLYVEKELHALEPKTRLRVFLFHEPPFVIKTETGWEGFCVDIFEAIADNLGLQYQFFEQRDRIYGSKQADGSWNGLIGRVSDKTADVGLGPIIQNSERKMVVQFTIPFLKSSGLVMLTKARSQDRMSATFFLDLFTLSTWISFLSAICVVAFLFWIFEVISPYSCRNRLNEESLHKGTVISIRESIWYVLGSCTQQGESVDPWPISAKMLLAGHWMFISFMLSMYSANLSARLAVTSMAQQIHRFDELIRQTEVHYTVQNNSAEMMFFKHMYDAETSIFEMWSKVSMNLVEPAGKYSVWIYPMNEEFGTCYNRMQSWGLTTDTQNTLDRAREGWIVFMEEALVRYYMDKSCEFRQIGQKIGSWPFGIVLPLNSILKPLFDRELLNLQANRVLENLEEKWWTTNRTTQCPKTISNGLGLYEFSGMFVFFGIGAASSCLVLLVEILVHRFTNRKEKKRSVVTKPISETQIDCLEQVIKPYLPDSTVDPELEEPPVDRNTREPDNIDDSSPKARLEPPKYEDLDVE